MNDQIQCVSDNMDKYRSYTEQLRRYRKAVKHEFYFEAMIILYAMIEDRCLAFLHYSGVLTRTAKKWTPNKRIKNDVRLIIGISNGSPFRFRSISGKSQAISGMIRLTDGKDGESDSRYVRLLKQQLNNTINPEGLSKTLENLDAWCRFRNEIVHGMLNKNAVSLNEKMLQFIEEGYATSRELDNAVKAFKKGNNIRKLMNIQ